MSYHIWAPEIHHVDGAWHVYFAAGRAEDIWAIRIYVLECSASDPLEGKWIERGHLKSNVNLHVSQDAVLAFSQNPRDYLPVALTRWEGVECMNYSAFIYAFEQENIAVTGKGTLDGQADSTHWWPWKGRSEYGYEKGQPEQSSERKKMFDMGQRGVPVRDRIFGEGGYMRPNFIQTYRCKNVLIEGVTILRSPMWEIHPVLCESVTVRGVTVDTRPKQRRMQSRIMQWRIDRELLFRHW